MLSCDLGAVLFQLCARLSSHLACESLASGIPSFVTITIAYKPTGKIYLRQRAEESPCCAELLGTWYMYVVISYLFSSPPTSEHQASHFTHPFFLPLTHTTYLDPKAFEFAIPV